MQDSYKPPPCHSSQLTSPTPRPSLLTAFQLSQGQHVCLSSEGSWGVNLQPSSRDIPTKKLLGTSVTYRLLLDVLLKAGMLDTFLDRLLVSHAGTKQVENLFAYDGQLITVLQLIRQWLFLFSCLTENYKFQFHWLKDYTLNMTTPEQHSKLWNFVVSGRLVPEITRECLSFFSVRGISYECRST